MKAVVKPKRGLGQATTRKRRQAAEDIQRRVKDRRAANEAAAKLELERMRRTHKAEVRFDPASWGKALLRSVVSNQAALLRAWGFSQSVGFGVNDTAVQVSAWTDFTQVRVDWPLASVPARLDKVATLNTVAEMKGFMQHEMGHLRFTTSWVDILEKAVVPSRHLGDDKSMHTCWNMMEDQRMECLVVEKVGRIKSYFGVMVLNWLVKHANDQSWLMLAGRSYMPVDVLQQSAKAFNVFCDGHGISSGAKKWADIMVTYKAADTHQKIMDAVSEGLDFIRAIGANMPDTLDDHEKMKTSGVDPSQTGRQSGSVMDLFKKPKPEEAVDGGTPGRDKYGDKPTKDPYKDDGKRRTEEYGTEGQSNGGEGDEVWSEQILHDLMSEAVNEFQMEIRNHADVREMVRNANDMTDTEGLREYDGTGEGMIDELAQRSRATALGIEQALQSFVTENAPTWHTHQDTGVLDALAYRTREVGTRTYRRLLEDKGNQGLDVHVSMLCDVSYSMAGGPMIALSEALYATGLACQSLGINATFTLWSSGTANYRVWADGNATPTVWPAMGGTDPTHALDDLSTHNQEKASSHLVIIFTDGQWAAGFPTLRRWQAEGRTMILVRYGSHDGAMQTDMGADKHININDVRKLPDQLTNALLDVLGQGGGW